MNIKKRRDSGGYKKEGIRVDIKKRRESGGYKEKRGVWWL